MIVEVTNLTTYERSIPTPADVGIPINASETVVFVYPKAYDWFFRGLETNGYQFKVNLTSTPDEITPANPDLNFTKLDDAINSAQDVKLTAFVSEDGSDVYTYDKWVTQAERDALETAIANGLQTKAQAQVQSEVDKAVAAIKQATETYQKAMKSGTYKDPITTETLEGLIKTAQTIRFETLISVDGSDIDPEDKWVTQETADTFDAAIASAEDTVENAETQDEVSQAEIDLQNATNVFTAAQQFGTKVIFETPELTNASAITSIQAETQIGSHKLSELTGDDFKVTFTDDTTITVEGTLNYIDDWSDSFPDEVGITNYYMPLCLTADNGMVLKSPTVDNLYKSFVFGETGDGDNTIVIVLAVKPDTEDIIRTMKLYNDDGEYRADVNSIDIVVKTDGGLIYEPKPIPVVTPVLTTAAAPSTEQAATILGSHKLSDLYVEPLNVSFEDNDVKVTGHLNYIDDYSDVFPTDNATYYLPLVFTADNGMVLEGTNLNGDETKKFVFGQTGDGDNTIVVVLAVKDATGIIRTYKLFNNEDEYAEGTNYTTITVTNENIVFEPPLNFTELDEVIKELGELKDSEEIVVTNDGAKVPVGQKWMDVDHHTALEQAYDAAVAAKEASRTQQEIDNQVAIAKAALETAKAAINEGTFVEAPTLEEVPNLDASDLEISLGSHELSDLVGEDYHIEYTPSDQTIKITGEIKYIEDYSDIFPDEVGVTNYYIPLVLKGTDGEYLKTTTLAGSDKQHIFGQTGDGANTIKIVLAIKQDDPYRTLKVYHTETDYDTDNNPLTITVDASEATFEEAPELPLDYNGLDAAISEAISKKADIIESVDGTEVDKALRWATIEDISTFNDAITTAQGVRLSAEKQQELNDAETTLKEATTEFESKIQYGNREIESAETPRTEESYGSHTVEDLVSDDYDVSISGTTVSVSGTVNWVDDYADEFPLEDTKYYLPVVLGAEEGSIIEFDTTNGTHVEKTFGTDNVVESIALFAVGSDPKSMLVVFPIYQDEPTQEFTIYTDSSKQDGQIYTLDASSVTFGAEPVRHIVNLTTANAPAKEVDIFGKTVEDLVGNNYDVQLIENTVQITGDVYQVNGWDAYPANEQGEHYVPVFYTGPENSVMVRETLSGEMKHHTIDADGLVIVYAVNETGRTFEFTLYENEEYAKNDIDGHVYTVDTTGATFTGEAPGLHVVDFTDVTVPAPEEDFADKFTTDFIYDDYNVELDGDTINVTGGLFKVNDWKAYPVAEQNKWYMPILYKGAQGQVIARNTLSGEYKLTPIDATNEAAIVSAVDGAGTFNVDLYENELFASEKIDTHAYTVDSTSATFYDFEKPEPGKIDSVAIAPITSGWKGVQYADVMGKNFTAKLEGNTIKFSGDLYRVYGWSAFDAALQGKHYIVLTINTPENAVMTFTRIDNTKRMQAFPEGTNDIVFPLNEDTRSIELTFYSNDDAYRNKLYGTVYTMDLTNVNYREAKPADFTVVEVPPMSDRINLTPVSDLIKPDYNVVLDGDTIKVTGSTYKITNNLGISPEVPNDDLPDMEIGDDDEVTYPKVEQNNRHCLPMKVNAPEGSVLVYFSIEGEKVTNTFTGEAINLGIIIGANHDMQIKLYANADLAKKNKEAHIYTVDPSGVTLLGISKSEDVEDTEIAVFSTPTEQDYEQNFSGRQLKELVGDNYNVSYNGAQKKVTVTGKVNPIENWSAYPESITSLTKYFLPLHVTAEDGYFLKNTAIDGQPKTLTFGQTGDGVGTILLVTAIKEDDPYMVYKIYDTQEHAESDTDGVEITLDASGVEFVQVSREMLEELEADQLKSIVSELGISTNASKKSTLVNKIDNADVNQTDLYDAYMNVTE